MKRLTLLLGVMLATFCISNGGTTPPPKPEFPPLQFNPPRPQRLVLPNGITVFLLEDHELPLVHLSAYFRLGSQDDPADKVGMANLVAEGLSRGGSTSYTPEQIETTLDRKAATLAFGSAMENGMATLHCRAQDFNEIFAMFADILMHPQFRKDKVELARSQALESLRRMNDDPEETARREFRRLMYGATHPYARIASPQSLNSIKRQDLIDMHARLLSPNALSISISGDFDSQKMLSTLQQTFGVWPKKESSAAIVPAPEAPTEKRVFYISRAINQTQIRIGGLGLARHSPDHFAWELLNELWGGSAASRLFRVVRTQLGLAYSVGSAYSEPSQTGLIVAVSQTRGSQTIAAIQGILKVSQDVQDTPFSPDEIQWAKESIRNRFVENFTSSAQIAEQVMAYDYFGFPKDYLDTYTAKVNAVTSDDLRRVAKTYMHMERASILIMGDLSTFEKPMSVLGRPREIKPLDYSQDQP